MVSEVVHRAGYDLSSWQGIAKLLADARVKLSPDAYHTFYDTVTAYSRSRGTDKDKLTDIEKVLGTWSGVTESAASSKEDSAVATVAKPVEEKVFQEVSKDNNDSEADAILAAAIAEQPTAITSAATPGVVTRTEPASASSAPVRVPEPESEPERLMTLDEARARIADIKHEVHELVGNPVVLVGELGAVGKTYMQVLLKATRATMGGASGGLMPAMRELESVYEKLRISALTDTPAEEDDISAEPQTPLAPTGENLAPIEPIPLVPENPSPPPEELTEKNEFVVPRSEVQKSPPPPAEDLGVSVAPVVITTAMPESVANRAEERDVTRMARKPVRRAQPQFRPPLQEGSGQSPQTKVEDDAEIERLRMRLNALEHKLEEVETKPNPADGSAPITEKTERADVDIRTSPEESVVTTPEAVIPDKKKDVPATAPAPKVVVKDAPLHVLEPTFASIKKDPELEYASEPSEGLRSLLLSWDIFRGGLLSGKARGMDHPTFAAVRDKTMSDVLAGKFEGAKTHSVISINDYVNAWRFEQGIEYNPLETFEHYLRRVIYRILSRAGDL